LLSGSQTFLLSFNVFLSISSSGFMMLFQNFPLDNSCFFTNFPSYSSDLKKLQESLSKGVQAVLKDKGGHTKYCLSSSLELNKLCFKCVQVFSIVLYV